MAVTNSWTLIIPYAKRNDYVDMVAKINSLVDNNGIVALFVCNVPYDLHSYLVVESDTNAEQINSLIKQYNIELDNEVGFTELLMEIANKKYNNHSFAPDDDKELIQLAFNSHYQFADFDTLKQRGFNYEKNHKRKKVFISYCHKEKEIVYKVTELLENSGVNLWIDKKDISIGDDILQSVLDGINECDLAILFLSKSTLSSKFSLTELRTVMNAVIRGNKKWYLVKLDDTDLNEIAPSLSNYLYFEYNDNADELVESIKQHLNKL